MKKQLRADLILLTVTLIWGLSFPLMRNLLSDLSAVPFLSLRFTLASVILTLVFIKRLKHINKQILLQGFIVGVFLFLGMILQVFGLYTTSASNSAFITGLNVVMVPLFLAIIFKRKTDKYSIYGVILATIGLLLISGMLSNNIKIGDVLTFMCAVAFSFQIIFIDRFTKKNDPVLIGIIQVWTAALLNLLVWGGVDRQPAVISGNTLLVIAITGIFGTAIAFLTQTIIQKDTTPAHTALIFATEPVFGAVFAMIIADPFGNYEVMTFIKVIGAALILLGTLLSEYKIIAEGFKKRWKDTKA